MRTLRRPLLLALPLLAAACASGDASHADAVLPLLSGLVIILIAAKLGGELATRLGQPSVLGELLAGVVLGTAHHFGLPLPDIANDPIIDQLARLGVVMLLFEVGLESTVPQLLAVGVRATIVAVLGVVAPIAVCLAAGPWLFPEGGWTKPLFVGAAMCATSVGITARVFRDLGVTGSPESRLIVGAAVIDDVLGLVVLSIVTGMARAGTSGGGLDWKVPATAAGLALVFLVGAIVLGPRVSPFVFRASQRLQSPALLLPVALAFAFGMAWVAGRVELAPIVGAYAAGLVLERAHYKTLVDRGEHELEHLVRPIGQLLVPIFFVLMGTRVQLWTFTSMGVVVSAGVLIAIAVVTKLVCALGTPKGQSALVVGLGMVPRGEVGLIFADAGKNLIVGGEPLLGPTEFSSIVLMVAATTLLTPPLLGWAIKRAERAS